MVSRRKFLFQSTLASTLAFFGLTAGGTERKAVYRKPSRLFPDRKPVVISTWKHGLAANKTAWEILNNKGKAINAVEEGVRVPEADPEVNSVGFGGLPDREGHVTLDACIMDHQGNCGGVAFLEHIKHPVSVARKVMEKTPHLLLCGEGALDFALASGFHKENLLTEKSRTRWEEWKKQNPENQLPFPEDHDTIGMLALDHEGHLAGACTTSGLAWKYHGRVGDSPIIGAGLYVDNDIGAATATGKGEEVIKVAGSFLVVELIRLGRSPQEACEEAIHRIVSRSEDQIDFQVGFLALDNSGNHGAYAIKKGFDYALSHAEEPLQLISSAAALDN